jgi:hypothetical protein
MIMEKKKRKKPSLIWVYSIPLISGGGRTRSRHVTYRVPPLMRYGSLENLLAVANQGCHLEGSSPYKGTAYRKVYCIVSMAERVAHIVSHRTTLTVSLFRMPREAPRGLMQTC